MVQHADRCRACRDTGHVCENHPHLMWDGMCCATPTSPPCTHGGCSCGGAGMPCPECCSPIPPNGQHGIGEAFVPDRYRREASHA